jgi:hypothetical protein
MLSSIRPASAIALGGSRVKVHRYSPSYKGKRHLCFVKGSVPFVSVIPNQQLVLEPLCLGSVRFL